MIRRVLRLATVLILPLMLLSTLVFVGNSKAGSPDVCAVGCTYSTIQEAVDADATIGTTLVLAAETFPENVVITRSITLVGAGSGLTIIDGQAADTVILVNAGAAVSLSGLAIQNGDASGPEGGGLLVENGTVTLSTSIVQNNLAPNGAGITNKGTMTIEQVTVQNNIADKLVGDISNCDSECVGGGIYNLGVMTMTNNSTIYSNTAQYGGGINNAGSALLSLTNVTLEQNFATGVLGDDPSAGGGLANLGTVTMVDSAVRNNEANVGAGVFNEAPLTINRSDVHGNIATTLGGGLHNSHNITLQTSNVYENEAGSGGGISSESGDVVVEQTAVYNNSATGPGGGIVHNVIIGVNSLNIINSTLSGNSTTGAGGGLYNAGVANTNLTNVTLQNNQAIVSSGQSVFVAAGTGTVTAKNSIIATNQAGANCSGTIASNGYNIVDDSSCGLSGTADFLNTNPLLGPLQNNGGDTLTHALLAGSPAINSGNGCPAVDQRGVARPFGPACDRGAYEFDTSSQSLYLPFVIRP